MKFFKTPSPNFDDRKDGAAPELVVIHYTGMTSTKAALDRLKDPAAKVSCHYLIDEAGNIHQMVDDDKRAWHAGVSSWQGRGDVNSRSIGIELSNRGIEKFTDKQLGSLILLCHHLSGKYAIPPENFIGHSDIAPDRKLDPGPLFPWREMAKYDIGLWPKTRLKDKFNAAAAVKSEKRLKALLRRAGYGVDAFGANKPALKELVAAFQSRYEPAVFAKPENIGIPTEKTAARMKAVARARKRKP